MAKTKTIKKTEKAILKPTTLLRKGVLAYVGLYGAAYESAKLRFEQVRGSTDGLFDTLVEKGEEIESKATVFAKDAQLKASETFTTTSTKVRAVLPTASNDRVQELEAEISKLNKKITTLAKTKKKTPAKKVKAQKTLAYTKSSLSKMLEKDLVALANEMGIEASVNDLKADTVSKILIKTKAPIAA